MDAEELTAGTTPGGTITQKDTDFYQGKIAAASFFARTILPKIAAERAIAWLGSRTR